MIPLRYNFRSLVERRATSVMTVLGVALVSMIFVIVFGFIAGLKQALSNAGQNSNWIILARGATSENQSFVPHPSTEILRVRPEVASDAGHHPLVSRESIAGVNISRTHERPGISRLWLEMTIGGSADAPILHAQNPHPSFRPKGEIPRHPCSEPSPHASAHRSGSLRGSHAWERR